LHLVFGGFITEEGVVRIQLFYVLFAVIVLSLMLVALVNIYPGV